MPEYSEWNEAIGSWFFHDQAAGEIVRLTVDANTLRKCMEEHNSACRFGSDEGARDDFIDAVKAELESRDFQWRWRLPPDARSWPDFLGLIGVQVLAVYQMDDDPEGTFTKNAYWRPLAKMLGLRLSGNLPWGFSYYDHRRLWHSGLLHWANVLRGGNLGRVDLPSDRGGCRHIRLPFSQALMRAADLERLGSFFRKAGFRPGTSITREQMLRNLRSYRGDIQLFSSHARRVLEDDPDRLEPACGQIFRYFEQWNGTSESLRRISMRAKPRDVHLSISVKGNALEIHFERPNRVAVKRLTDNDIIELLSESELRPLSIGDWCYRPWHRDFLLAVYDEALNRYSEKTKACPGDRIRLLLRWEHKESWLASVGEVALPERTRQFCFGGSLPTNGPWRILKRLPKHWCLVELELRGDLEDPPPPWADVVEAGTIRLRAEGGLRLSNQAWLAGAGPAIRVHGRNVPRSLFINDQPVEVEGQRLEHPQLNEPGVYIISVNRSDQGPSPKVRIEVREACSPAPPERFVGGWVRDDAGWPQYKDEIDNRLRAIVSYMVGPVLYGAWLHSEAPEEYPEREMLTLLLYEERAMGLRLPDTRSKHPLVAALRMMNEEKVLDPAEGQYNKEASSYIKH